jgi:hypothetical protein
MSIKLNNVRLSFPSLFQKAQFNGEETKYEATFLLDKVKHADVIKEIKSVIANKISFELKGAKVPADKLCLRDGDEVEYDGYSGHMTLKASTKKRPLVLNKDKSPLTEEDGVVYSGCYVNAIIDLWTQNNNYGKRINATLLGVQFAADGEAFSSGGSSASVDDFDDLDGEAF